MPNKFRDFDRGLRDLRKRMQGRQGEHNVALTDLFPPDFMRKHSEFGTIEELFAASPWNKTPEEFAAIPDDDWDAYIQAHTSFPSWNAMQNAGAKEWAARGKNP